jgi:hypothetical protein
MFDVMSKDEQNEHNCFFAIEKISFHWLGKCFASFVIFISFDFVNKAKMNHETCEQTPRKEEKLVGKSFGHLRRENLHMWIENVKLLFV